MAVPSQKLVTRLSGKIDGLIAARVPLRNGTQITNTRSSEFAVLLKMLLCTQLAPARHVGQVGEKMRISRACPSLRLNNDFSVPMLFSAKAPPWPALLAVAAAPVPDDVQEASRPGSAAITAAASSDRTSRNDKPIRLATRIPILVPDCLQHAIGATWRANEFEQLSERGAHDPIR